VALTPVPSSSRYPAASFVASEASCLVTEPDPNPEIRNVCLTPMTTNTSVRHTSYADQYKLIVSLTEVGLYGRVSPYENALLVDRDVAAEELNRVHPSLGVSPERVRTAAKNFTYLSWPYPETSEEAMKVLSRMGCYNGRPPTEPHKLAAPALHPSLRLMKQARPVKNAYGA
jgi:hypothetical protein